MAAVSLEDLSRAQLAAQLADWGFSPAHAQRLWRYVYRDRSDDFETMAALPARLRAKLSEDAAFARLPVQRETSSPDGATHKYLLQVPAAPPIETVLMQIRGRATVCISSQSGCPVGCVFCATGQMGFARNLSTSEIVAQVLFADRVVREQSRELSDNRRPGTSSSWAWASRCSTSMPYSAHWIL